jgi:hypothetical protein
MIENPYAVGDTVLASRSQDGENHEEAKVVDAYSLIIGGDERPMICVAFADGERVYLRSDGPDVRPLEESGEQGGVPDEEHADG